MHEIWFMLHLFGFAAGASASVGNTVVLRLIASSPADAPVLGKVSAVLSRVGQVGVAVLWITGIIMVSGAGRPELNWAFWVKLALVIGVTAGVVLVDLTAKKVRQGDMAAAAKLPLYGGVSGALLVLVVVFAVIAFG